MLEQAISALASQTQAAPAPKDPFADRLLCVALDVSRGLLKNGDHVHHVEETLRRICTAYGAEHIEVFVIPSLIMASVRMPDGGYSSQIRQIQGSRNHLSFLEEYNRLSRRLCGERPDLETAAAWIKEVKSYKPHTRTMLWAGHACAAGIFAVFFGGSLRDGIAGALVGLVLALLTLLPLHSLTPLAKTMLFSLAAGICSYLTVWLRIGQNIDMIMIGSIMLLIPGLAFGNALRDLLCGDILTGILKTVQSILTAILIAAGFSVSILGMNRLSAITGLPPIAHPFWICLLTAVGGTLALAAFFCVKPKYYPVLTALSAMVYTVYELSLRLSGSAFPAAFLSALCCAACAELLARIFRAPVILFVTPGTIAIVPGSGLYYAMSALLSGNLSDSFDRLLTTLQISAGLAAGTFFVTMTVSVIREVGKKKNFAAF